MDDGPIAKKGCAYVAVSNPSLVILHTNDIHSHFEPMPRLATVIRRFQRKYGRDRLLVVDCGDHLDRMRIETEGSVGVANIDVMNATGYEFAVPGNNEGLTFSKSMLQDLYEQHAHFTVLGSNLYDADTNEIPQWLQPYAIVQKGAYRIGIIGVTARFTDFYELLGWDVRHPLQTVAELAAKIRAEVDLLIVLSHLGVDHDKAMAEQIGTIDLILGAHTHHLFDEPVRWGQGAYLCAAGKFGGHLGVVELELDGSGRLKGVAGRCISADHYPPDPEISALVSAHREIGTTRLNRVTAALEQPLESGIASESPLGNLLAIGLRKWTNAEIGLVNAGQLLGGLGRGPVTDGMLHRLCPSPINPCRMLLRGEQIRNALEEALLPEYIEKPIRGFGFRGHVLGTLCVDGLLVEYDTGGPPHQKITTVLVNGVPMQEEQIYSVGTIDMFTFGVGYRGLKEGQQIRFYLPEFIRDVLRRMLQDTEAMACCQLNRWKATIDYE